MARPPARCGRSRAAPRRQARRRPARSRRERGSATSAPRVPGASSSPSTSATQGRPATSRAVARACAVRPRASASTATGMLCRLGDRPQQRREIPAGLALQEDRGDEAVPGGMRRTIAQTDQRRFGRDAERKLVCDGPQLGAGSDPAGRLRDGPPRRAALRPGRLRRRPALRARRGSSGRRRARRQAPARHLAPRRPVPAASGAGALRARDRRPRGPQRPAGSRPPARPAASPRPAACPPRPPPAAAAPAPSGHARSCPPAAPVPGPGRRPAPDAAARRSPAPPTRRRRRASPRPRRAADRSCGGPHDDGLACTESLRHAANRMTMDSPARDRLRHAAASSRDASSSDSAARQRGLVAVKV